MPSWVWTIGLVALASLLLAMPASRLGLARGTAPRDRDLHDAPRSRLGGIAVALPALVVMAWSAIDGWVALAPVAVLAFATAAIVGAIDDLVDMPTLPKLLGEAAVGVLLAGSAWLADSPAWAMLCLLLVPVATQNAFNFVDGSDGLLAATTLAIFATGAVLSSTTQGAEPVAFGGAVAAAAVAGFLPWNLPRARLFMGDGGSLFLGAVYAWCTVQAFDVQRELGWAWFSLGTPILGDVVVCIARRMARGAQWWTAHREHAYQRVVARTGSHGVALAWAAGLELLIAVPAAIACVWHGATPALLAMGACIVVAWLGGSGLPALPKKGSLVDRVA